CSLLGFAVEVALYILLRKLKYIRDSDDNKFNTQIGDELRLSDPRNQENKKSQQVIYPDGVLECIR
ncbi:hypothetical protein GCK32_004843, partial [Trichostrongylus colubriformis]